MVESKTKSAPKKRPSSTKASRAKKTKVSTVPTGTARKKMARTNGDTTKASREINRVVDQAQEVITEITVRARDASRALAGKTKR